MRSVLLIGTGSLGASFDIKDINEEKEIIKEFGYGTLLDGYRMIKDEYKENIKCVKVTGTHGTASFNILCQDGVVLHKALTVITKEAKDYGDIDIEITPYSLNILYKNTKVMYEFDEFKTIGELIKAINQDARENISPVRFLEMVHEANLSSSFSIPSCNKLITRITKARDGINSSKDIVYNGIKRLTDIILGKSIDIICPIDCFIDDTLIDSVVSKSLSDIEFIELFTDDFKELYYVDAIEEEVNPIEATRAYITDVVLKERNDVLNDLVLPDGKRVIKSYYDLFFEFSKNQSINGIITKSVLGFKKGRKNANYYNQYSKFIDTLVQDGEENFKALISICVSDLYYDKGAIIENMYISYAGALASTRNNSNIENAMLSDNILPFEKLDVEFVNEAKKNGFITSRLSPLTKKVHVLNAKNKSIGILAYEYTFVVLNEFYKIITPVLSNHIGEILTPNAISSFDANVKKALDKVVNKTIVKSYTYGIDTNHDGDTFIRCSLDLLGFSTPFDLILELGGEKIG